MRDGTSKNIKILHCADIHMDAPFTSIGSEIGKSSIRRQDLKETFQKVIDLAGYEKVDLLLICGDLYEHNYVRKSTIEFINHCFSEIQDTKVILIPGNHDPYTHDSYYKNYKWNKNVIILNSENPFIFFEEMGTCVYSMESGYFKGDPKFINILVAHGTLDMEIDQKAYNPMSSKELEHLNMDYIALGHFHKMFRDYGKYNNIFNPGSPEPMGFDEPGAHGVFISTITKTLLKDSILTTEFISTNKRFYETIEIRIDQCNADQQIISKIGKAFENKNLNQGLFKIIMTGYIETGFRPDIPYILSIFEDRAFFIKAENLTKPDYDFEEISREPGLRGLFVRKILNLIDEETDEFKKEELERSLYYGMEALDYGEVHIELHTGKEL